jgi:hypothetical protein
VTRVVIVASGRPNRSQLAALWLRNSCAPFLPFPGNSLAALIGTSGVDRDGRAQTSKGGVLAVETSKSSPSPELPGGLSGGDEFKPSSPRDWLRLLLFAVLGISLVLAIRHTVRDLRR